MNPYDWLKATLEHIPDAKLSELDRLLPGYGVSLDGRIPLTS